MMNALESLRRDRTVSDYAVDRQWATGSELPLAEADVARRRELEEDRESFQRAHPRFRRPERTRASWRMLLPWLTASAVAAAALVTVSDGKERTKGPVARLGFWVEHDGEIRQGASGEILHPNDRLRFTVRQRDPSFVAILAHDRAGVTSVYYPAPGASESVEVASGLTVALPLSTRLDDTLGQEQIFGVFCAQPEPIETLRLSAAAEDPLWPSGCVVEVVTIQKVAR